MNTEKIKVLYVDDEEGNLKAFKATFRRDFDVHIALTADEGMAILDQETIHVVISDQRMPRVTGAEFLAQVRDKHPRAMRMLLTGYSDMEAVVEAINKGGIYCYTTKPWDPADLKLRIEQAHEVYALRDDRESLFKRYQLVFDASGDPILIMDATGKVHDANPATAQLLGLPKGELPGLELMRSIEHSETIVKRLRAHRSGRTFTNVDLTLNLDGGRVVDCLLSATYLGRSEEGTPLFQAMVKDISERKHEEARLRKLNQDLDRRVSVRTRQLLDALEDLGSFSYTVAHDLRSPLKNILALCEHAKDLPVARDPDGKDLHDRIQKGTGRMIQLVDDLLRFAQTNTRELQREEVDVEGLFNEVVADHVPAERKTEVSLELTGSSPLPGDRAMLKVMLGNLIGNALKYSRTVQAPHITIGHELREGDHLLWVRDNGVGFASDQAEQVFGAFKRLHRNDQFEGTGVGLAIVQRVVSKHGGSVWAESEVGKGTTIYVKLPADPAIDQPLSIAS